MDVEKVDRDRSDGRSQSTHFQCQNHGYEHQQKNQEVFRSSEYLFNWLKSSYHN